MTVTSSNEIKEGTTSRQNRDFSWNHTRVFRVESNDVEQSSYTIITQASAVGMTPDRVPIILELHPAHSFAFCIDRSAGRESDTLSTWIVTAEYSSKHERDPATETENPFLRPPEVSGSFSRFQTLLATDKVSGLVPANSAGQPLEVPIDESRGSLVWTHNEGVYPLAAQNFYRDTINSDVFLGVSAGKVKVMGISSTSAYENGYSYYRVTYEFEFRREGWDVLVPDEGTIYRVAAGGAFVKTERGEKVGLNANGTKVAAGSVPNNVVFKGYDAVPFAPLGIYIP